MVGSGRSRRRCPMGFSYVSSNLGSEQVTETDARTVRFTLQRGCLIYVHRYRVQSGALPMTFSGVLRDSDLE